MFQRILNKLNSIPADKVMHFASGVVLYALLSWVSPVVAFTVVVFAAVGKEVYDFNNPNHTTDILDAMATILGGVVGLFITFA